MNPWEEKWEPDEESVDVGDYVALDAEGYAVITAEARNDVGDPDKTAEARLRLATAAPDLARVALRLRERGEQCLSSLPDKRTIDDLAAMETTIPVSASILRDALAALRKAGVLS